MCDYSLEMYQSRPAVVGEEYKTARFPSGSIGLVAPGQLTDLGTPTLQAVAVCLNCDQKLKLEGISDYIQNSCEVGASEDVVFIQKDRVDSYPTHRDAVRFANGKEITLQLLGAGVTVVLVEALTSSETPVPQMAELDA